jgi:thiol-disulfide isomerase/thioredoxin
MRARLLFASLLLGTAAWSAPDAEQMIGRRAPSFHAPLLEGKGELNLAALKGKVAILDFWATWCAPCTISLPIVRDVAGAYAAKGVVFYAVNEAEERGQIRSFLKRTGLDLQVALDEDGDISELFGADGIPHTVIIDRAGVIRAVYSGFEPDMRRDLRNDLDRILAKP